MTCYCAHAAHRLRHTKSEEPVCPLVVAWQNYNVWVIIVSAREDISPVGVSAGAKTTMNKWYIWKCYIRKSDCTKWYHTCLPLGHFLMEPGDTATTQFGTQDKPTRHEKLFMAAATCVRKNVVTLTFERAFHIQQHSDPPRKRSGLNTPPCTAPQCLWQCSLVLSPRTT